jgi:hypothetical protein
MKNQGMQAWHIEAPASEFKAHEVNISKNNPLGAE